MTAQPSDFDKDATSDEGIWRECAARLKIAMEAESQNRIEGIRAKQFRWGDQWDADVRNTRKIDGRPALTVNHTNVFCSRTENTLRQQRPRIKCHPVGDGANVETASKVNGLIRHIEDRSVASVAYDQGASNSIDIGWGYWRIVSEYLGPMSFDQELLIRPIRNPFTVYMDPSAVFPDGRDQGWCIVSEMMSRAEYKRRYPTAKNVEWAYSEAPGDIVTTWESKTEIRLAEYYRIHEVRDSLVKFSDGSVVLRSKMADPKYVQAVGLTIIAERDTTRCVVQWFRLNGRTIIDRRTEPEGVYHIPVVRCEGNVMDVNGIIKRKGMVQDLIDPAQMFNYTETSKTERYALTPKAPWVGAEGQFDGHPEWNDANQKSYSTLVYKPVYAADGVTPLPPPQRTPPAPVEAGMAEWSSSAERNLMAVAGMAQENPEISARVVSGNKYLQRRQGMQDLTHFQYYDNQTLAIAWTGTLLLERIPKYYDTQRMQRILGEDGRPEMLTINEKVKDEQGVERIKNDMTVGLYSIVMDTGPGYATQREEAAENMVEMLGTPLGEVIVKTGPDIVLRNMDFHGADELADRAATVTPGGMEKIMEGLPKQAQTIIGALQAQLQQKDELINQQALEIKYGAQMQHMKGEQTLEKTSRDNATKLAIADKDNATKLDIEDSKASTARDVAEIHGATQLLNTQVESVQEEKMADKMIKAGTEDRRPNGAGK